MNVCAICYAQCSSLSPSSDVTVGDAVQTARSAPTEGHFHCPLYTRGAALSIACSLHLVQVLSHETEPLPSAALSTHRPLGLSHTLLPSSVMPPPPSPPPAPHPSLSSPPRPPPSAAMKNENIVVAVRVRPYTRQELERHENVSAFEINTHTSTIVQRLTHAKHGKSLLPSHLLPYAAQPNANSSSPLSTAAVPLANALTFQCDRLYPSTASTAELYDGCVRDIVDSAMAGMNGSVFCYGQTASGKTHTMKGDSSQPGLLSLSMQHVFAAIEQRMGDKWLLRVSYIEIYNERIRDLLEPNNDNLAIHVTKDKGAHVTPREEVVRSVEECIALLEEGEKHRHYGCTQMNDFSSRSHTIFRLTIENKPQPAAPHNNTSPAPPPPAAATAAYSPSSTSTSYQPPVPRKKDRVRVSVLNFVDLAGSERQAQTGAQGSRLKEGTFINKSLLNLGIVIAKLSEQKPSSAASTAAGGGGSDGLIPFRDSKLTHILSGSLGGNSRVCVVCCVSAAVVNCEHSVSTLRFGSRCARVRQSVKVNEVSGDAAEINRYEGKIKQLQNRLSVLPAHSIHTPAAATAAVAAEAAKARRDAEREEREEKEAMWEQRRLLAEDRVRIEEERARLEQQISSFKQLMLTATSQQLTGTAAKQAALSKRRATLGNGRRSAEWKEAASTSPQPNEPPASDDSPTAALTADQQQHDYYRSQQQSQRVAALESRVHSLETLLKELNGENDGLMREYEETAADGEAMAARLEELVAEAKQREAELAEERRQRLRWEKGEGVDALPDEELAEMRRAVDEVRRVVERQVLWREFCRAREDGGGSEEASRMERERRLKDELQRLRQQTEEEQRRQSTAHAALTSEHQSLQQQQADSAARLAELQQQLEAIQATASEAAAESAEWKRQYEEAAATEKQLRGENTEYSKRLLDVVRPAGTITLPVPFARLAANNREASSLDGQLLLSSAVSYSAAASAPTSPVAAATPSPLQAAATPHFAAAHSFSALSSSLYSTASSSSSSFQPANLSSALAAAASSSAPSLMSAHMPHTAAAANLPPPLSLDALMSSAAPPPLPQHPPASLVTSHSSPLPLVDVTAYSVNAAAAPARPPTPTLSRPPSPFAGSASKVAGKGMVLSAGKRAAGAVSSARRK